MFAAPVQSGKGDGSSGHEAIATPNGRLTPPSMAADLKP